MLFVFSEIIGFFGTRMSNLSSELSGDPLRFEHVFEGRRLCSRHN
jgi:hypothetical protein